MKIKSLLFMMLLFATSVILLSSCSGGSESIEYWKVYIASRYGVSNYCGDYLQNRFNSMTSDPDEYQLAYYNIAVLSTYSIYDIRDNNEMFEKVRDYVEMRLSNDDYPFSRMISKKAILNMKSHPDLYIDNACKIIGSIDELKKEIASHVKVKKKEKVNVANFDCYNVLYGIDEKRYVICRITEKGNGQSEIQVIAENRSINEILDYWQAL